MIELKIKNDELEKVEPRTLCEEAWQEIASHFPDFKVLSKGQKLKRVAKDKDICFEIYFQANRYNNKDSVEFIPHIGIYSKSIKRAGINKHISWHCARHSFAVNILNNGANIKTVASLLGHSGLKHTEKYTRAVDKLKSEAINSLPELKL